MGQAQAKSAWKLSCARCLLNAPLFGCACYACCSATGSQHCDYHPLYAEPAGCHAQKCCKQAISLTYRTTDTASQKMLVSGSYEAKPNQQYQLSNQRDLNSSPGMAMAGLNGELAQAAASIALA
jgi:hypothetical protein